MIKYLGIYIHIPFCASKCAYCDFYSLAGCDNLMPKYQEAIIKQIKESIPLIDPYYIDTVYFGGGTPSYYGADRLISILNVFKRHTNLMVESEVTLEANPDSITYSDLKKLHRAGFNRISIGMQSASDQILKGIGRRHNFQQVVDAVKNARTVGFKNISLDLIYGLPEDTREGWVDTLSKAMELQPEHISCYGLKIEPGTPLYDFKDYPGIPDDDAQADMYLYAVEELERCGYKQYEISNFAKPGFECKHNLKYWNRNDYMGFGTSAYSCTGNQRYGFIKDIKKYISGVENGKVLTQDVESLSSLERASEYIMLSLRTSKGISEREYWEIYRSNFDPIRELLRNYESRGWVKHFDDRWSFTPNGFLISNALISEILDAQAEQQRIVERN